MVMEEITKTQGEILAYVEFCCGGEKSIYLWYDPWHPRGPLLKYYGSTILYGSGSSLHAKLSTIIDDDLWDWPTARSRLHLGLQSFLSTVVPAGGSDVAYWLGSNTFRSSRTLQWLRRKVPRVPWFRLVWFTECIPKHSSITWLVILSRESTRDKQLKRNPMANGKCVLCGGIESRNHLFFECPFSAAVLFEVMAKVRKLCPSNWH